jgi:hypothetical protein
MTNTLENTAIVTNVNAEEQVKQVLINFVDTLAHALGTPENPNFSEAVNTISLLTNLVNTKPDFVAVIFSKEMMVSIATEVEGVQKKNKNGMDMLSMIPVVTNLYKTFNDVSKRRKSE